MTTYLDGLWEDLERTWDLAMTVNDLPEAERADPARAWEERLKPSPLVDVARTEAAREGRAAPAEVFCANIYGLRYNAETGYWIPFRHGDIDIAAFMRD